MPELTYYDYINAFYELLKVNPPSANAQLLYHTLLMEYNRAIWQTVELHRTNSYICGLCGLGDKALTNAKNELKQLGLIDFVQTKKKPTKYILLPVKNTGQKEGQTQVKRKSNASQTQVKGRTYKEKEIRNKIKDNKTPNPFTGEMSKKFDEWLAYKRERGQVYKPTGLNSLINKIQKGIDTYGQAAIMSAIDNSISNNWQGLFFDKIDRTSPERNLSVYNSDIDYDGLVKQHEELERIMHENYDV